MLWTLLILLALGSSVNILLLGGTNIYRATNQTDITTDITTDISTDISTDTSGVASVISLDTDDEELTVRSSSDNVKHAIFENIVSFNKTVIKNILSISALAAALKGIFFNILLIVVFLIFYLNLFKSKPDDLTLVNQKVRLDD